MRQNALTIIARIKTGEVASLEVLLDHIGGNISNNAYVRFSEVSSLHFACWVVINNDPAFPPSLVFESNYDGGREDHLRELIREAGPGLDAIYGKCEKYPAEGIRNLEEVLDYLRTHVVSSPAFYIGCPGETVTSIRNAIALRQEIEKFLDDADAAGQLKGCPPQILYDRISDYISRNKLQPQLSPTTLERKKSRAIFNLILLLLIALPVASLLSPLLIPFAIMLRIHEKRDAREGTPPPLPIDMRLFEKEDVFVQNHLTTLVNVKPGAFRLRTLKFVLWLVNLLARIFFINGNLGGIPTIHFARWILMDSDKRLLFFSNYDGSWASYLGDFVDKANYGLTAIWSNTEGFPPTRFLFWGGAQHIQAFKQWSRENNIFAAVWYSGYPDETLVNLLNDIHIRDTLGKSLTDEETRRFLKRL